MKIKLYIPYYDYNDGAFDVNEDYYNGDDYIKAMSKEYDKTKDVVFNSIMDAKNGSSSLLKGVDGQTYVYGEKTSQNEEKIAYSCNDSILYNSDGEDENVDTLIDHFAKQESFVEMIEFDENNAEEEFITEISVWVKEHNSISKYEKTNGDEWCWLNEPTRNLKISFKNKSDEDIYAMLEGCKIMDVVDNNSMIVFIDRMKLIDN